MNQSKITISNIRDHNLNFLITKKSNLIDQIIELYLKKPKNNQMSKTKYKVTVIDNGRKVMELYSFDKTKLAKVFNLLNTSFFN